MGPLKLTQHFADIWLDVHILEVLVRVRMVQPQGGIQPDRNPHAVTDPGQLPYLALPPGVGIEGLLQSGGGELVANKINKVG